MNEVYNKSIQLREVLENVSMVYLHTVPDVLDFSVDGGGEIIVDNGYRKVSFSVSPANVCQIASILETSIFNSPDISTIFSYNIKSLLSYFRFYLGELLIPNVRVLDIHVIESFLNILKKAPESLKPAIDRFKQVSNQKNWMPIYQKIHLPLIYEVMPTLETTSLLDESDRALKYPYYEIEGQANGRLNCLKRFKKSYLPHNLGPEQKNVLKPKGYNKLMMSADYRHCEVTVLQWLSQDRVLLRLLESGRDLHSEIYKLVTGDVCDTENKRNISKKMFLPVIYGSTPTGLARSLNLPKHVGEEISNRIKDEFSTACEWADQQQRKVETTGRSEDYFGRPRVYEDGKSYLARNSVVQGVAATVCQEKLIQFYKALRDTASYLTFTVHDSYVGVCDFSKAKEMYFITKETLESESSMCDGLKMKVEIKFGNKLNNMKIVTKN